VSPVIACQLPPLGHEGLYSLEGGPLSGGAAAALRPYLMETFRPDIMAMADVLINGCRAVFCTGAWTVSGVYQ
jgi:hypothetical protein